MSNFDQKKKQFYFHVFGLMKVTERRSNWSLLKVPNILDIPPATVS